MSVKDLIIVAGVVISGVGLYYTIKNDKEGGILSDLWESLTGGSGGSSVEQTPDGVKKDDGNIEKKTLPESSNTQDFKMSIYTETAKNLSSGSSGSKKKTIQVVENNDLNFSVVKVNNESVGGFDFKTNQTITKKQVDLLDKNKNNSIVKILRGF